MELLLSKCHTTPSSKANDERGNLRSLHILFGGIQLRSQNGTVALRFVSLLPTAQSNSFLLFREAYAFHIVPELNLPKADMKSYFDDIADVVKQADEANKEHLFVSQFFFEKLFLD